jgi:hypothetical protein
MIDAEDAVFGKELVQHCIQLAGRLQIAAERLLDDHPRIVGAIRGMQLLDDGGEHAGRNRQVVRRPAGMIQLRTQPHEGGRVAVIAIDVAQVLDQGGKRRLIEPVRTLDETGLGPLDQLIAIPA